MAVGALDRPIFIGGTGSDGAASLALLLNEHTDLQACEPVRFGVISDPKGVVDAMLLGQSMRKASRTPWLGRLLAEKQPAFHPEPMMGEERTPPEELVEMLHRNFLPDPLLKPVGHRAAALTPAIIERASERYLASFWDDPASTSVNLVHDLLAPTHGEAAEGQQARRWVDASRLGAVRAPHLLELFPEAVFLHVVRDGREVALRFMEISTGSAFPGAPVSSVPIDPDKEWNQAAFDRALGLWERRLVSAASGLRRVPADRLLTIRLNELIGPGGPELLATILKRIGASEQESVTTALPRYLSRKALREGRVTDVAPASERSAINRSYNAALARLADLGVPLP